jgi:hypothetical protein
MFDFLFSGTQCATNKVCIKGSCVNDTLTRNPLPKSNACSTKPCLNKATCVSIFNMYVCKCPAGFNGQKCENKI